MTISIAELQSKYQDKRTHKGLESLIEYLLSCGVKPTEITTNRVSKIFGYKSKSGIDTLTEEDEGLTGLILKKLGHYKPELSFDSILENLLVGQYTSNIDRVYEIIKNNPGILLKVAAKRLNLSKYGTEHVAERLINLGLAVCVRWYDKDSKHSFFRYFPTKHSGVIKPTHLRTLKSVRNKKTFEYLLALYIFKKLSTPDLAGSFQKTTNDMRSCLNNLIERGIVKKSKQLRLNIYKLSEIGQNTISHTLDYLREVDQKSTNDLVDSIGRTIMRQKFSGTRIIIKRDFFEKVLQEIKRKTSLKNISKRLEIPYSTLKTYMRLKGVFYTDGSIPYEVIDGLIGMWEDTRYPEIKWREVENSIKLTKLDRGPHAVAEKAKKFERILREHGQTEILKEIEGEYSSGKRIKIIREELKKLPVFTAIAKAGPCYNGEISDVLKEDGIILRMSRILDQLEILEKTGLIQKKFQKYFVESK